MALICSETLKFIQVLNRCSSFISINMSENYCHHMKKNSNKSMGF